MCALLASSDVRQQFGGSVANGKQKDEGTGPLCEFAVTGSSLGASADVSVLLNNQDPGQYKRGRAYNIRTKYTTNVVIPGALGEYRSNRALSVVDFAKDSHVVTVQADNDLGSPGPITKEPAKYEAALVRLATHVAQRV